MSIQKRIYNSLIHANFPEYESNAGNGIIPSEIRGLKFRISILLLLILFSCKTSTDSNHTHDKATQYTCPMHPQIIQESPGKCSLCGMDLIIKHENDSISSDIMLSDRQLKLANITTQKIILQTIEQKTIINGRLVENNDKVEAISSHVGGRIEKLFIKERGRTIKKGEPLYQLFSEELLTYQKEYLLASEQAETLGITETKYQSLLNAAKRKLVLYGLAENQITKLINSKEASPVITFLSPVSGVITELNAKEGQYVSEGESLFIIASANTLWVEAELYPIETARIKAGNQITVSVNGFEDNPITAAVTFISPVYRSNSQVTILRATIANPDLKYRAGMQALVFLTNSKKTLTLSTDAVIQDGHGIYACIQRGHNTFRFHNVKTGIEDNENIEIKEGIEEGDTVVVTGAYLLYSELILKKGMESHLVVVD